MQVGDTYCFWTVVAREGAENKKWRIRCRCGAERLVGTGAWNAKTSRSCRQCQMEASILARVGEQVGQLVIIGYAGKFSGARGGKAVAHALCRCRCGNEVPVRLDNLPTKTRRQNKTCGCGRSGSNSCRWKGFGGLPGEKWGQIQKGARERGIPVEITIQDAWALFEAQDGRCALTGWPLSLYARSRSASADTDASLDRIDNSLGYIEGNVQWVHKWANQAKNDLPESDFVEMCRAVADYHSRYR